MMGLSILHWYVIAINLIAFGTITIDFQLFQHHKKGIRPEVILNLVIICGGALGALLAEILWDPKITKENAQSRLYTIFWLIIQVALCFAFWGKNRDIVQSRALGFYNDHKALCIYYAAINVVTFIVFAIDKIRAKMKAWRIREVILLGL